MKKYAKEIVLVLITAIVVSVISVSATVYFNSENITFEPEDTNWNVSSTSSALNDLYNTSNTKITNFKTTIAQAITDMGVTTTEDADAETMANNIRSISSSSSSLTLIGTYTGNQTIDVSAYANENDTKDSFIISITKLNGLNGGWSYNGGTGYGACVYDSLMDFTYNTSNKTITTTMVYSFMAYSGSASYVKSSTMTYNLYHI